MTKAKEVKQPVNEVDLIWEGWLNGFKTIQNLQQDISKKSLQAFENQKELLNSTRATLTQLEAESNKISEEWKFSLQKTMKESDKERYLPLASTWLNQLDEINSTVQALSWTPSKVMLDLFSQSQVQLESNVKNVLDQQQKGNAELLKSVEKLTDQLKETHKKLLYRTNK
ncbi:polyhydroxyalkanoic acid inclusion protein [Bacillus sp. OxB-1]|uniref:hypothetical protein n=1 Tax=Bacillus sp. (strain OxB-1) TaxID=98228 RepID=UPI000581DCBC|nr:hypothetical protein [Bacillus sp. OxB-1]BAQ10718.1 polyhydroxyalkanoic acid inclusion protein [Bacillus sp. OxB-1]